jgi:hypothetical protein
MNQILHIFRKDTRRFWPEIVTSLVITAAFAAIYPSQWMADPPGATANELRLLANVFTVLVPVSWWLLIARVVHAESLVGESQFWLTRPYRWTSLLAAKALFLLVWLYAPIFLAQWTLLAEAGLHPEQHLPGLLFELLLLTAILVFPLFAIAAVTANFARMTLTLLGVLVAYLIFNFAALGLDANSYRPMVPGVDRIAFNTTVALVLLLCGAAVLLQYAGRRVWQARTLLIALPILATGVLTAISATDAKVDRAYASATPFAISLAPDTTHPATVDLFETSTDKYVHIPLTLSGIADGTAVQIDDARVTLTAADGQAWTSPWQGIYAQRYLPGANQTELRVRIPRAQFERFKSAPVMLQLTLALTRLRASQVIRTTFPIGDIEVPNVGMCSPQSERGYPRMTPGLYCRSPLHKPRLTYATTAWSEASCLTASPDSAHVSPAGAWIGEPGPAPADPGIPSVWTQDLLFNDAVVHGERVYGDSRLRICPGTPLTITQYTEAEHGQAGVAIANFKLPQSRGE